MHDIEEDHDTQHQNAVEDVKEHLMRHDVSSISLYIFNDPEDRPKHDQTASVIESMDVSPPRDATRGGASGRDFVDAEIEDRRDDDEEAEEDDLKDKTTNHKVLTIAYRSHCTTSHDAGACRSQLSVSLDCCV